MTPEGDMVIVTGHAIQRYRRRIERGADPERARSALRRLALEGLRVWRGRNQREVIVGALRLVVALYGQTVVVITCYRRRRSHWRRS